MHVSCRRYFEYERRRISFLGSVSRCFCLLNSISTWCWIHFACFLAFSFQTRLSFHFSNQAEALPAVKRVNISLTAKQSHPSASYAPVVEEILPCPPEFIPNEEWQRGLLYSFSELRSVNVCLTAQQLSQKPLNA